jgi:hypothetical protein
MPCMSERAVRHLHKLMTVAEQPGGLQTMSDDELLVWAQNRRAWLARAEQSARFRKDRRACREDLAAADAELARRGSETG